MHKTSPSESGDTGLSSAETFLYHMFVLQNNTFVENLCSDVPTA